MLSPWTPLLPTLVAFALALILQNPVITLASEQLGIRRNLKLGIGLPVDLNLDNYNACLQETYDLSLLVDNHIFILVVPTAMVDDPDCTWDTMVLDDGGGYKEATVVANDGNNQIESALHLGTFTLDEIITAYESATVMEGTAKDWDVVTNNCITFITDCIEQLGIYPHSGDLISTYIVEHLDREKTIIGVLRKSATTNIIIAPGTSVDDYTDLELVELLVQHHLETH